MKDGNILRFVIEAVRPLSLTPQKTLAKPESEHTPLYRIMASDDWDSVVVKEFLSLREALEFTRWKGVGDVIGSLRYGSIYSDDVSMVDWFGDVITVLTYIGKVEESKNETANNNFRK